MLHRLPPAQSPRRRRVGRFERIRRFLKKEDGPTVVLLILAVVVLVLTVTAAILTERPECLLLNLPVLLALVAALSPRNPSFLQQLARIAGALKKAPESVSDDDERAGA